MNIVEFILLGVAVLMISIATGAVASALGCRFGRFLYEKRR